jgi:hypothetical protein
MLEKKPPISLGTQKTQLFGSIQVMEDTPPPRPILIQFEARTNSFTKPVAWDDWAPPKCKFFAWLILQDRVWTVDRLTRRGWPNCGICQLWKCEPVTTSYIMFKYRYSIRVWKGIKKWLDLIYLDISHWIFFCFCQGVVTLACGGGGPRRKGLSNYFCSWLGRFWISPGLQELCFDALHIVLAAIKWNAVAAGAKLLNAIMLREYGFVS